VDLAFLKDKKFQLAAGGGAVLALVVLIRKKQGGGGSTSSTTGTAGTLGTYTDNGMDAYQNLNNELEGGLAGFQTQITSIQDQLSKLSPKPSTSSGPSAHQLHVQHLKNKGTPKAKPDAHQQHVQHVKNKGKTPTAHQLHVQHVKNKGPAPRKRR
jgi:hypothetical protein